MVLFALRLELQYLPCIMAVDIRDVGTENESYSVLLAAIPGGVYLTLKLKFNPTI